jgi:biotin synthase
MDAQFLLTGNRFAGLALAALEGRAPADADLRALLEAPDQDAPALCRAALAVRLHFLGRRLSFCAIVNVKSGNCSEDCAFCAQSARHRTTAPRHGFLDLERIAAAARAARQAGASRLGLVTSGLSPADKDFERLEAALAVVRREGLAADASPGVLDPGRLERLRAAGLAAYHHNLETSRAFFPRICTTHAWDEDAAAVAAARAAGLAVCSGGLFGLGESWGDRMDLALALRRLGVASVPMNFLNPIPGTRLENRPVLSRAEALKIIALYRFLLPGAQLRVCGGRPVVFGGDRQAVLLSGADGLMIGDYLTTPGEDPDLDRRAAQALNFRLEGPEEAA